uniref:F-box domain-containing protein n=1 Tax=Oryza meridionalis TaxID=40149 RepID=A0A0E0ENQ4_9ORYZ
MSSSSSSSSEQCDVISLPEDQVFEMLTRVSLDDLAACRQVSTRWRRLTYEPAFAPLHCRRADAVSGYLVQTVARNRYHATFVSSMHPSPPPADLVSLDFLPSPHVRVEAVSLHRGLVCCVDADADAATPRKPASYYVCKPATRQWRALPNPRLRYRTAATAMAARPGGVAEFKIVRFSVPTLRDCLRCEVFDSRRMEWRRSADVAVWPESLVEAAPAVRAHGAMHWLRWPDRLSGGAEDIFAFDVKTETWRLIGLPPEATTEKRWAGKKVAAVEGKLCLVVVVDEEVEIWVLASYRQERWEKKMTASLTRLAMEEGNSFILRDLYASDVAFFNSVYRVLWYDFLRGKIAEAPLRHKGIQQVFKFESDLVPFEEIDERPNSDFKWVCKP